MVRKRNPRDDAATNAHKQRVWDLSSNATAEAIEDWDIKPEQFIQGVLEILSSGAALMLGTTMSGAAVSITIYEGDEKQRVYVADTIEWDDFWLSIVRQAQKRKEASRPQDIRAIGD